MFPIKEVDWGSSPDKLPYAVSVVPAVSSRYSREDFFISKILMLAMLIQTRDDKNGQGDR
jgi:hypothetical protein